MHASWCAHAIGNLSFITKMDLVSVQPDLLMGDTTVGASTETKGSLCLPDMLQSDCTFLASTSRAPLSDGERDMAVEHLEPTFSPL